MGTLWHSAVKQAAKLPRKKKETTGKSGKGAMQREIACKWEGEKQKNLQFVKKISL